MERLTDARRAEIVEQFDGESVVGELLYEITQLANERDLAFMSIRAARNRLDEALGAHSLGSDAAFDARDR